MTAAVAIIDANVVVSGFVSSKQDSSVVLILEGMRSGSFRFLLSTPLFNEYREVLLRPKLRKLHCRCSRSSALTRHGSNPIVLCQRPTQKINTFGTCWQAHRPQSW